jgi:zinc transport system ATP-binding protein
MGAALVTCRALEVGYGGTAILPPADVALKRGQFCAVVGRNGSGKTTWLKTVLGLIPAVAGRVEHSPALKMAYVPQRTQFDAVYPLTARQVAGLGHLVGGRPLAWHRLPRAVVDSALQAMGVGHLADQPFRSLSEGQKQRVLFARVVVTAPDLAFLDEPTASMDVVVERELLELVDGMRRQRGMTVVMVTQDLAVASEFADETMLVDGPSRTVLCGTPRDVIARPEFARLYGEERVRELMAHLAGPRGGCP